jgi:hypothetical protein
MREGAPAILKAGFLFRCSPDPLYVSISRGRIDARVYTDDADTLRFAVTRNPKKEIALEAVKQRPAQQLKPDQETPTLQPRQSQSIGISI